MWVMTNLGIKILERGKLIWARTVAKKLKAILGEKNSVYLRLVRLAVSGAVESSRTQLCPLSDSWCLKGPQQLWRHISTKENKCYLKDNMLIQIDDFRTIGVPKGEIEGGKFGTWKLGGGGKGNQEGLRAWDGTVSGMMGPWVAQGALVAYVLGTGDGIEAK